MRAQNINNILILFCLTFEVLHPPHVFPRHAVGGAHLWGELQPVSALPSDLWPLSSDTCSEWEVRACVRVCLQVWLQGDHSRRDLHPAGILTYGEGLFLCVPMYHSRIHHVCHLWLTKMCACVCVSLFQNKWLDSINQAVVLALGIVARAQEVKSTLPPTCRTASYTFYKEGRLKDAMYEGSWLRGKPDGRSDITRSNFPLNFFIHQQSLPGLDNWSNFNGAFDFGVKWSQNSYNWIKTINLPFLCMGNIFPFTWQQPCWLRVCFYCHYSVGATLQPVSNILSPNRTEQH